VDSMKEWMAFIGRRNIAYVVFVSLLVPFGTLIEAAGPHGPDSGGGIMAAIILSSAVSLIFFIANAGLAIGSIARGRSATKPLIADRMYHPPLVFGALLRGMTVFRPSSLILLGGGAGKINRPSRRNRRETRQPCQRRLR
jgi:hypothetical protein